MFWSTRERMHSPKDDWQIKPAKYTLIIVLDTLGYFSIQVNNLRPLPWKEKKKQNKQMKRKPDAVLFKFSFLFMALNLLFM